MIKGIILFLVLATISITIGFVLGKKTKNTKVGKKINKNFEKATSKGTIIIVCISGIIILSTIIFVISLNASPNLVGKTYTLNDENNLSSIYFKDNDIVVVDNANKNNYKINSVELHYKFNKNTLEITQESGAKMIFNYNKNTDCLERVSGTKYCNLK